MMHRQDVVLPSELILNSDGSIYHLNLLPGEVAPLIILVGDPGRVGMVSKYFDEVTVNKVKREFVTHTGRIGETPITVISTGIGTDNVDIVMNEIDALFNVDFVTRTLKPNLEQLTFVRIGTSGAIQKDIPVDTFLLSRYALGFDALSRLGVSHVDQVSGKWFDEMKVFTRGKNVDINPAYMSYPDEHLMEKFVELHSHAVTVTCGGFYGLQGRSVRLKSNMEKLFQTISEFEMSGLRACNLEMETAGIYLLGRMLGHRTLSLNAIIANRALGQFSEDPYAVVDRLIDYTLRTLLAQR